MVEEKEAGVPGKKCGGKLWANPGKHGKLARAVLCWEAWWVREILWNIRSFGPHTP